MQMFKNKSKQQRDTSTEEAVLAEVNDASAEVSEQAACCLADIDEVLADMDDVLPAETEEQRARREANELWTRFDRGEITYDDLQRERDAILAKYAHLELGACWC